MLDLPRYLLGVAELAWLAGFAVVGASALRTRLLPDFSGAPGHLATTVVALALLIWTAEILGSFGLLDPVPYLAGVALVGSCLALSVGGGRPHPPHAQPGAGDGTSIVAVVALAVAVPATVKFGIEAKPKLTTGMTGFDSTWYHGPFAAGFFQGGNTWSLHFIAPQFLAWFYPANAEIFHGTGMLAFGRDLLSPLLNVGWFVGCLLACWCIGRPYGVAPWSLALGAVALSLPVLSDQAGEARNDIVGVFFLLAAVAVALNAGARARLGVGAVAVAGLAAGLAAGAKLNFLLPAAVLVLGLALVAPGGRRARAFGVGALAALAGGGYWYLRNLVHSGNPLPWLTDLGPLDLPGPDQPLGGREGHSVLGYLTDATVWSDWLLPGLRDGLTVLWPLLALAAAAGLVLAAVAPRGEGRSDGSARVLSVAGLVGLAAALAWLIAPTSASGPEGMPRGFESGLRYLAPALVLGLTLLPAALLSVPRPSRRAIGGTGHPPNGRILKMQCQLALHLSGRRVPRAPLLLAAVLIAVAALGYPVQRHYLEHRYESPSFAEGGLNAAFAWARDVRGARIATTATRQYPLLGTGLSNEVEFVGEHMPEGGFVAPETCERWRQLLNAGDYDYVVASRDRVESGKPPYPATARWTESPRATEILREPPTVVYKLSGPLDPRGCPP